MKSAGCAIKIGWWLHGCHNNYDGPGCQFNSNNLAVDVHNSMFTNLVRSEPWAREINDVKFVPFALLLIIG